MTYELQMGTLGLNDFVTISGEDPHSLASNILITDVVKGRTYTFRYRAINAVGNGEYSDLLSVKAASKPAAPPKPTYTSSTSTSVTLGLVPSEDNGGSQINTYKLYRDAGNLSSGITTEVTGYDGASSSYTITGLTAGTNYRFAYSAVNDYGESD